MKLNDVGIVRRSGQPCLQYRETPLDPHPLLSREPGGSRIRVITRPERPAAKNGGRIAPSARLRSSSGSTSRSVRVRASEWSWKIKKRVKVSPVITSSNPNIRQRANEQFPPARPFSDHRRNIVATAGCLSTVTPEYMSTQFDRWIEQCPTNFTRRISSRGVKMRREWFLKY